MRIAGSKCFKSARSGTKLESFFGDNFGSGLDIICSIFFYIGETLPEGFGFYLALSLSYVNFFQVQWYLASTRGYFAFNVADNIRWSVHQLNQYRCIKIFRCEIENQDVPGYSFSGPFHRTSLCVPDLPLRLLHGITN